MHVEPRVCCCDECDYPLSNAVLNKKDKSYLIGKCSLVEVPGLVDSYIQFHPALHSLYLFLPMSDSMESLEVLHSFQTISSCRSDC